MAKKSLAPARDDASTYIVQPAPEGSGSESKTAHADRLTALPKELGNGGALPARADPNESGFRQSLRFDLPASIVVLLVALPLCLGIAVASGAPPLSGLIAGAVGGIVVGSLSGSQLAVSGPAAGLTTIVFAAIQDLGLQGFLLAGLLAGGMQIALGLGRAGVFAYYIPSSVIKGMLAAIGIILMLKQIPHALGDDLDFEGDLTLLTESVMGPFEALAYAFRHIEPAATLIAGGGLLILVLWNRVPALQKLKLLPAPLVVVAMGTVFNALLGQYRPELALSGQHLVSIPTGSISTLWQQMTHPDFARLGEHAIWSTALTIAAVASLETLLCIEAIDKLDPYKRSTHTNRELLAQGAGNSISSLLGGLPLTAVIVRGSANIHSGARTKTSTILHGVWLVLMVFFLSSVMNQVPLAALAAILLHVGYKLAKWEIFKHMFKQRIEILAPFVITIVAILFTDLLKGVGLGLTAGLFFILRENASQPFFLHAVEEREEGSDKHVFHIELSENVSFLNKAAVNRMLQQLPRGCSVDIDGSRSRYIHADVTEILHEFHDVAPTRGISLRLTNIPDAVASGSDH